MSADDWIKCPHCSEKYEHAIKVLEENLKEAYNTMIANEYAELKRKTLLKIGEIEQEMEEKAYASIYDKNEYHFDEHNNFVNYTYVICPNCYRLWKSTHVTSSINTIRG